MTEDKQIKTAARNSDKLLNLADIVISNNGRDIGKKFLVLELKDGYSLIADGKSRKCDKPKLKKNKHITIIGKASDDFKNKLASGEKATNSEIRRALAEYTQESGIQPREDIIKCQKTT